MVLCFAAQINWSIQIVVVIFLCFCGNLSFDCPTVCLEECDEIAADYWTSGCNTAYLVCFGTIFEVFLFPFFQEIAGELMFSDLSCVKMFLIGLANSLFGSFI